MNNILSKTAFERELNNIGVDSSEFKSMFPDARITKGTRFGFYLRKHDLPEFNRRYEEWLRSKGALT